MVAGSPVQEVLITREADIRINRIPVRAVDIPRTDLRPIQIIPRARPSPACPTGLIKPFRMMISRFDDSSIENASLRHVFKKTEVTWNTS
jgi:hypothetical protein